MQIFARFTSWIYKTYFLFFLFGFLVSSLVTQDTKKLFMKQVYVHLKVCFTSEEDHITITFSCSITLYLKHWSVYWFFDFLWINHTNSIPVEDLVVKLDLNALFIQQYESFKDQRGCSVYCKTPHYWLFYMYLIKFCKVIKFM